MSDVVIGVIGTGRVGSALARALAAAAYRVGPLWSRRPERATACATAVPGAWAAASPQAVADDAQLVIVATPDRVIGDVAVAVHWRPATAVVHTSGGTPVAALSPAATAGCATGGWHPLKSFAGGTGDTDFHHITFAIEAEADLRARLYALTAALGGSALDLRSQDRPLYHASAALASNALVALLAQAAALWARFGRSREDGLTALLPLVRGTVENLSALGLPHALTGPVERGDVPTVAQHLAALAQAGDGALASYRALSEAALDLAAEKGRTTEQELTALRALLADRSNGVALECSP